ncbi:hypothetical protein XENOCAPTIV_030074, partial [Xenoophorus captivus]
ETPHEEHHRSHRLICADFSGNFNTTPASAVATSTVFTRGLGNDGPIRVCRLITPSY